VTVPGTLVVPESIVTAGVVNGFVEIVTEPLVAIVIGPGLP
jgi:hypothetical protein